MIVIHLRYLIIKIIDHVADLLVSNQEEPSFLQDLLANRQKTHFYDKYADQYYVIKWANRLIKYSMSFLMKISLPI